MKKRLYRSRTQRMIGGVCGGIAGILTSIHIGKAAVYVIHIRWGRRYDSVHPGAYCYAGSALR